MRASDVERERSHPFLFMSDIHLSQIRMRMATPCLPSTLKSDFSASSQTGLLASSEMTHTLSAASYSDSLILCVYMLLNCTLSSSFCSEFSTFNHSSATLSFSLIQPWRIKTSKLKEEEEERDGWYRASVHHRVYSSPQCMRHETRDV